MKPTRQPKLNSLNDEIRERTAYLKQIEEQIQAVTEAGNNQILAINAEVSTLENEKARLLKENFAIEQRIREKKRLEQTG